MKLIIDMPDIVFNQIKQGEHKVGEWLNCIECVIKNSTPYDEVETKRQTIQQESDCVENMNEQETFIEEEKKWSYEQGYKDGSIEGSAEEYDKGWRQGFLDCLDNKGYWEEIEILPEVYDIEGVKTWASKMMCSRCGFTTIAIEGKFTQYNGCPNCFADMRGKRGDEE